MSEKETKDKTFRFRMTSEDYDLFVKVCECIDLTPSKYVRMLINTTLAPIKVRLNKGEMKIEDIQAYIDNKLQ